MATKIQKTVVAMGTALTLSIAGHAMADSLIQGGFESFGDGAVLGEGAVLDAGEVAQGFGAPLNSDLAALTPADTSIVTTTGGSGITLDNGFGSNTRGAEYSFSWSHWNDGDAPAQPTGDNVFVAVAFVNDAGFTDLTNTTGLAMEMISNASANQTLRFTISDGTNSYQTKNDQAILTDAGGADYATNFDSANWEFSDGTDIGFSSVLGNVQRIGFSFLLPKANIDSEPFTNVTIDNLRITPEPTSMMIVGAGCLLLMSSRKLRRA